MNWISGGYVFVGGGKRPGFEGTHLLPERLWTPSSCISEQYPGDWGFLCRKPSKGEIEAAEKTLNFTSEGIGSLHEWMQKQLELDRVGLGGVFIDYDAAIEFGGRFLKWSTGIKLLGVGLREEEKVKFLAEARPHPGDEWDAGFFRAIELAIPPKKGGRTLGFEPLGYDLGGFHSFLCCHLDYFTKLGLTLNEHGRFDDFDACECAVEHARLDSTGEPALWQSWLVSEYERGAV